MGIAANKLFKICFTDKCSKSAGPFQLSYYLRVPARRLGDYLFSSCKVTTPLAVEIEIVVSSNHLIYLLLPIHSPLHAAVRSYRTFLHLCLGSSVIQE